MGVAEEPVSDRRREFSVRASIARLRQSFDSRRVLDRLVDVLRLEGDFRLECRRNPICDVRLLLRELGRIARLEHNDIDLWTERAPCTQDATLRHNSVRR